MSKALQKKCYFHFLLKASLVSSLIVLCPQVIKSKAFLQPSPIIPVILHIRQLYVSGRGHYEI